MIRCALVSRLIKLYTYRYMQTKIGIQIFSAEKFVSSKHNDLLTIKIMQQLIIYHKTKV